MELADALTITGLGMAVVFTGLLLTAGLIVSFSVLPWLLDRGATAPDAAEPKDPKFISSTNDNPVPQEVVSVIAAVLEVERRLYHAEIDGRLTIQRPERAP